MSLILMKTAFNFVGFRLAHAEMKCTLHTLAKAALNVHHRTIIGRNGV